jgi:carboxylate-amine ligase
MRPFTDGYDEAFSAPGVPRSHYAELFGALDGTDLARLREAVNARTRAAGVRFGSGANGRPFIIDPIPRILFAGEWARLVEGLEQRVRALNAFVADAYGERRIVAAGLMAEEVIETAQGYEPELCRVLPLGAPPIGIAGLDIVRDPDGGLQVLEDNVRTPSGFTYAKAARDAVVPEMPDGALFAGALAEPLADLLGTVLRDAAPDGDGEPSIVVLSDGPEGSAWYEHAEAGRLLGAPVVTVGDLTHRGDDLYARVDDGTLRRVEVVYRRTDEDRLRDERGDHTPVAAALLRPWLAGRVAVVNAFGTGVADDKLVHAHVEAMIRFYLAEEPALAAVPTLDLGDVERLDAVLSSMRDFVVKPRLGHGGAGVVVCAHAEDGDIDRLRGYLSRDPGQYIAQPTVTISHHPTVVDGGRLEPRHVDLRPFIFSTVSSVRVLPGGLTRVAWDAGALVVNSSQNGGAKDTWVLR